MFGFLGDNIDSVQQAAEVAQNWTASCCIHLIELQLMMEVFPCRPTTPAKQSLKKALGKISVKPKDTLSALGHLHGSCRPVWLHVLVRSAKAAQHHRTNPCMLVFIAQ
jgi:hypothetical protein